MTAGSRRIADMAELLIRVKDKVGATALLDSKCTKRGDVIVVQEDGWPWGKDERELPFYRILQLPNITVNQASTMLAHELDTDPQHPSRTLQRRMFKLDLSNVTIPAALKNYVQDDTRASPAFSSNVGVAFFQGLIVRKTPIADPAG